MAGFTELRKEITEFVDKWDPKVSLIVIIILGVAGYLGHAGSERAEITKAAAEWIHNLCLAGGVLVGILQVWNWSRKQTAAPVTFHPPVDSLSDRDLSELGLVFPSRSGIFGFPKFRFFVPEIADLECFVEWSEGDPLIGEANDIPTYKRRLLYQNWQKVNPNHFLIMQRKETVGNVWTTVAISIILDLPQKTIDALRAHRLAVVDIHIDDLTFPPGERKGRSLLYDTLIFSPSFRERFSDFKWWHTLFHFSLFPLPHEESKVSIFIEPDNPKLQDRFDDGKYGPYQKSTLVSGHDLYEFVLPDAGEQSVQARRAVDLWEQLQNAPFEIPTGGF